MRLRSLTLERYGVFEKTRLELDPAPGRLNLIYAPNGGGKSQLVHAFCDLLFGIHGQSPMDFRFDDYAGMRLSAEVEIAGVQTAFTRRKGRGNTLLDTAGQPIDPALVRQWLGSVADRDRLLALFALDSHRLRQAEGQLKDSDGTLAEALLSGTGELHPIRDLKARLEKRRDEIGIPKGRAGRPLNAAGAEWEDAGKRLRAATQSPEQHAAQDRQWRKAVVDQQAADKRMAEALAEARRLERMAITQPAVVRRDAALAALAALPDQPLLDPALASRVDAAEAARVRTNDQFATARRAAEEAASRTAAYSAAPVLAHAEAIDALGTRLGAAAKAREDAPTLERERNRALEAAAGLLRQLGLDVPPQQAASVIPARAQAAAVQAAIATHTRLRSAVAEAADRVLRATTATLGADGLARPSSRIDTPGLEALCTVIRADGAVATRRREAEAAVAAAEAALAASVARIPGWTNPAELLALAPQDSRSFDRLHEAAQDAAAAYERCRATAAQKVAERTRRAVVVDQTRAAGAPPDQGALIAARARRDAGWTLVLARLGGAPDPAAEAAYAQQPIGQAFHDAVTRADAIADERFRGASTLANLRQAENRLAEATAEADAAGQAAQEAQQQSQAATTAWGALVAPLRLPETATTEDVRGILAARTAAIDARERQMLADAHAQQLAGQHAAWADRLAAALGTAPDELDILLATADQVIREAGQFATEAAKRQVQAAADAAKLREETAGHTQAQARLAAWAEEWRGHLQALGRPAGEHPDVTAGLLGLFDELRDHVTLAADRGERIAGITAEIATFEAELAAVQRGLGLAGSGDAYADARGLAAALADARQLAALAAEHTAATERAQAALAKAEAAHRQSETELRAVLALCGVDTTEAARVRLHQSAARRDATDQRDAAEQTMLATAGSLSLDALLAEAATLPPDAVPGLRNKADQDAAEQSELATRAAVQASELRRQLTGDEADDQVRVALADQSAALATAERTAEEALVLHLAAIMLDRGLKRVENERGDAGLGRISALFSRLTGGGYSRLEAVDAGGAARLRAVDAAWPKEHKSMQQLSEGTRDQLCLALRMAAIEDHVKAAPALPFIGDDILQSFDDHRSLRAMEVLTELSQHNQVILLTHHRSLLNLAGELPAGSVHVVQI